MSRRVRLCLAALAALATTGCGYLLPTAALAFLGNGGKGGGGTIVLRAEGADLVVSRGPQDPGDTTEGRGVEVVAAQLRLTATRATTLRRLTLGAVGTGDDAAVPTVRLVIDADGDGVVGPSDPQLGATRTFSGDDGQATFDGLAHPIAAGASLDLLVVVATPAAALEQDTFAIEVASIDSVDAVTLVDGAERPVNVFGVPLRGGVKTISRVGSLRALVGPNSPQPTAAFADAQGVALLQLELRASSAEGLELSELRLRTAGTGHDVADVAAAHLWTDVDGDGRLDPLVDDPIVVGAVPQADDGLLVFGGLSETLPASGITRWLVVYDFSGAAADGATFRVELAQGADLVVTGAVSREAIVATGAPVAGSAITLQRPSLMVEPGPINPARTATAGATKVPVLQLRVRAGAAEPVVVASLGVRAQPGGGDDAAGVAAVELWHDVDGDGVLDPGEPRIAGPGLFPADDGTLVFGALGRQLAAGATEHWLVTYDIAPTAQGGETFQLAASGPADVGAHGATSGLVVAPTVSTAPGGALTIVGSASVAAGPDSPGPTTRFANDADVPLLQVRVTAGPAEAVRVTSLGLQAGGSAHDAQAVALVELWHDVDQDGAVGPGDVLLRADAFTADDGALALSNPAGLVTVPAGGTVHLLVRYVLSGQGRQGETLRVTAAPAGVAAVGVASGLPIAVGGAPVTSADVTLARARLTVAAGPANPPDGGAQAGQTGVPALQLEVLAGPGEDVELTGLTLESAGTADEPTAVLRAWLYREGGGALGVVDPTDVLIGGPATFSADDGALVFDLSTAPPVLGAGTTSRLLLVYDLAPTAPAGGTLRAQLASAAGVTARGAQSSPPLAAEVLGGPASGGQLTIGVSGPDDPVGEVALVALPGGVLRADEARRAVLALEVRETTGNAAIELTSLAVTSVGTGDETTDVRFARLFRDLGVVGTYEPGIDVPIGLTAFFAEPGTAVFAGLAEAIPAGGAASFLVTYDMADGTQVTDGESYQLTVGVGGVALRRQSDGAPVTVVSGLPIAGPVFTGRSPHLTVTRVALPGADPLVVRAGARDATTLRLRLTADAVLDVVVDALTVESEPGGGDEADELAAAVLYRDVNADGRVDAGDVELARRVDPFAADGGAVTFSGLALAVPATGEPVDLLVAFDVGLADSTGDTFRGSVADAAAVGVPAGVQVTLSPVPATGRTLQVGAGVTVALGGYAPTSDVMAGETAMVLLTLTADPADDVTITSITLGASGAADDANDVSSARLYLDDGDAIFEPGGDDGSPVAGPLAFPQDDGEVTFTTNLVIPAGATIGLWCSLEVVAPSGKTVRLSLQSDDDLVAGGAFVSGAPLTGPTFRAGSPAGPFEAPASVPLLGGGRSVLDLALGDLDRDGDLDLVVLRSDGALETYLGDGAGAFDSGVAGPISSGATRLALGDMNGDGDLDVVTVGGDTVRVFLQGAGGAADAEAIGGVDLVDLALVDLDRDGDLDVLVADAGGLAVRALVNDGSGGLTPGGELLTAAAPRRIAVADVNRDGRPDLLLTAGGELKLALHDGASFFAAVSAGAAIGPGARDLAVVDLDREGRLDVVVVDQAFQQLSLVQGLEVTLSLAEQAPSAAGLGATDPRELVVGDWDGDGRPDLAVVHASGGVITLLGTGTLTLGVPPVVAFEHAVGGLAAPDLLVAGDLDRDGDVDLVVASTTDTSDRVVVLLGDGETNGGVVPPGAPAQIAWPGGGQPIGVAAGDFDRDGHPDYAVVGQGSEALAVFLNDGDASGFTLSHQQPLGEAGDRVRAIDLDGDGRLDLVATVIGGTSDALVVLRGNGDGTFQAPIAASCLGNANPVDFDLADFDGDGHIDAVAAEGGTSTVQLFRGTGTALADAVGGDRRSPGGGATPVSVAFVDADRDGHLDVLVLTRAPARLMLWRGVGGDLEASPAATIPLDAALGTPSAMALGDIDRDGALDVVVTSADASVMQVLRGRPQDPARFVTQGTFASGSAVDVALADLDKDGRLDIVAARAGPSGEEAIITHRLLDPATFTFDAPVVRPTQGGGDPRRLAIADFDRDGDLDVLAAIRGLDAVQLFPGE